MRIHPLRLGPGDDLRPALEAVFHRLGWRAAFVLQAIGSLDGARLRFAGRDEPTPLHGDLEILTLAGSLSARGAHLHVTVADADGRVVGGHVLPGCRVRTTAEVLVADIVGFEFDRELDPAIGFAELTIRPGTDGGVAPARR